MNEQIPGRQIDLPLLIHVGLVSSHSALRLGWHAHAGFELLCVVEGETAYEFRDGRTIRLPGGHFVLIPPGTVHRGHHDVRSPSRICGLAFRLQGRGLAERSAFSPADLAWMQRQFAPLGPCERSFGPELGRVLEELSRAATAFQTDPQGPLDKPRLRTLICATLLAAARRLLTPDAASRRGFVAAARDHLREHLDEPLRITPLARQFGMSRTRFFELFKAETGLTPNDYLQRVRIEKATELLTCSDQSVTMIAFETGFTSSQYFSKVFQKYAGHTPSAYRRAFWAARRKESRSHSRPGCG
jgi:AraC-like DNA-binding protein/mannose-6-phosphate isomerase-like protein (cupin superfamily)